jgi:hypothetical protein
MGISTRMGLGQGVIKSMCISNSNLGCMLHSRRSSDNNNILDLTDHHYNLTSLPRSWKLNHWPSRHDVPMSQTLGTLDWPVHEHTQGGGPASSAGAHQGLEEMNWLDFLSSGTGDGAGVAGVGVGVSVTPSAPGTPAPATVSATTGTLTMTRKTSTPAPTPASASVSAFAYVSGSTSGSTPGSGLVSKCCLLYNKKMNPLFQYRLVT